ncbi:response regulator transcription factor [Treponema brennaborense]|uniref:Two component transcriptional regulator, winged helix family n=1 Tax=Treponema brennaborense (strain DSM 12168 / CIP 105900 / DD5/3) TaxID=906968 RepID=F4LLD8_TREBD|nr:response regulator transcription factor [Treponema brennaborense]AEE15616.1 two component transcriptional regulator, winged helix family [Treponema brennaborense DSM 12168]
MSKILVIEDNKNQLEALTDRLKAEGYDVLSASDGTTGAQLLAKNICSLALIDIMLPGKNGFDIITDYRRAGGSVPVIFVSAKSELTDKVSGLRLGADDYVTKPYDFPELIARIEALLRRTKTQTETEDSPAELDYTDENDYVFGPFRLVFKKVQLLKDGKPVPLSLMECKLLMYLVVHRGELVKTDTLMEYVWGYETAAASGTLYTHISWLRKKLKTPQVPGGYIETVRNIGYIFSGQ